MVSENDESAKRTKRLRRLLCEAAAKAVQMEDPWGKYNLPNIPAERVIRHLYHPDTRTWTTDETIVKMEKTPFTNGAMRFCYRMKMKAIPPTAVGNHRFYSYGWSRASNYIAKAYMDNGKMDVSDETKASIKNDVLLQYESQMWADKFNQSSPPKSIDFIRAYAIEFPDRLGQPMMAVERFISGKGAYGAGFMKHNTNSGFVDQDLKRITPQLFSAHSFYASEGTRLVADIQGVGDMLTDPQVLSSDYRFGDGDLGPRGMALFFKTFKHSEASDAMGIPSFPLSKNEIKSAKKSHENENDNKKESIPEDSTDDDDSVLRRLAEMDLNRLKRQSITRLKRQSITLMPTVRRNNSSFSGISSIRLRSAGKPTLKKESDEMKEVKECLERSRNELPAHQSRQSSLYSDTKSAVVRGIMRQKSMVRATSAPMMMTEVTKENLGRVHYQLARLHGMNRFPEDVVKDKEHEEEETPTHDAFSVLFHLSYAAAYRNVPACLALARVHAGLSTVVSDLITTIVPADFDAATTLLHRAMESPCTSSAPRAAAGCLLLQIYKDEALLNKKDSITDAFKGQIIEDTLNFLDKSEKEDSNNKLFSKRLKERKVKLAMGDRVEANYMLEGNFYPASVVAVFDEFVEVKYDDDDSVEKLPEKEVKLIIPPSATQTHLGGPLSDDNAFGGNGETDEKILFQVYELKAELAGLKEKMGDNLSASTLFEEAADAAIAASNMKTAAEWSLKAAELCD